MLAQDMLKALVSVSAYVCLTSALHIPALSAGPGRPSALYHPSASPHRPAASHHPPPPGWTLAGGSWAPAHSNHYQVESYPPLHQVLFNVLIEGDKEDTKCSYKR
jgi:hypothetical protein